MAELREDRRERPVLPQSRERGRPCAASSKATVCPSALRDRRGTRSGHLTPGSTRAEHDKIPVVEGVQAGEDVADPAG
jgi:hypothetical protein